MDKQYKFTSALDGVNELLSSLDEVEREENRFMVTVAVKLRRLRRALGLTQAQAAEKCGMKQAMISKMESGDYNPSISSLFQYTAKLGGQFNIEISPQLSSNSRHIETCACYGSTIIDDHITIASGKTASTRLVLKKYNSSREEAEWSKAANG